MDFDLSKENIQPLRGGRNAQQLGIALQAQTNEELQQHLLQQRENFERLIRNYEGDDPLELYYNYISWVEQSYPKHGYEGNLASILETCLSEFENDERYRNDRRFCKLWIKYIDLLKNPLELYHMMKAKGLCIGCADFYKAWAYYYEAAGDFQNANNVFEEGKLNLAQPYDELQEAHKNLVTAAGEHVLYGPNENRLKEKRQALMSLHTYRPGRVGSVRVPSSNGIVTVGSHGPTHTSNSVTAVYQDRGIEMAGAGAAPQSIIDVARRHEAPKENTMKPGPWTTVPVSRRVVTHRSNPGFTVLEDSNDPTPINFPPESIEDYSGWRVSIKYPEEPNPRMIPMYPKDHVYIDPQTEFSIDELRATRYRKSPASVQQAETCQAVQSILVDDDDDENDCVVVVPEPVPEIKSHRLHDSLLNIPGILQTNSPEMFPQQRPQHSTSKLLENSLRHQFPENSMQFFQQSSSEAQLGPFQRSPLQDKTKTSPAKFQVLEDDTGYAGLCTWTPIKEKPPKFAVYEQTMQDIPPQVQPKGSAMKTAFKSLNADELAETGSRGGMDVAATAQAADSAKPMPFSSDNSSSSFEDLGLPVGQPDAYLNESCTTQQFNFNLNAMQVSTPASKRPVLGIAPNEEELQIARKQLFTENKAQDKALSTIFEETKSGYGSTSSSSGATTKSSIFSNNHTTKMAAISEEHNSYLAQNLKANAALRSSLLGDLMDFNSQPPPVAAHSFSILEPPVPMQSSPIQSPVRKIPVPAVVKPMSSAPSDPFKNEVIAGLLERVAFPGPHHEGYVLIQSNPRLVVKKEAMYIGGERYVVEKQLGKGTFGTVFKALNLNSGKAVALKYQKPPNKWEYYICRELQARLAEHPLRDRFMDVSIGYFGDQASILVSDFMPFGSLLDASNVYQNKNGKMMKECLCVYFTLEMLSIVKVMHEIQIIHADIKPDNFLVFLTPNNTLGLQLIDFGCSIDMTLYPPGSAFTRRVTTEDFICCEMRDGRPWNYHTDLFCIAATTHVLLFRDYIQLTKTHGMWSITQRMPRYLKVDLWNMFFSSLLNQQNGSTDISSLDYIFAEEVESLKKRDLPSELRSLTNLLKNR